MTDDELYAALLKIRASEKAAGVKMFMGIPDHWYENLHWRCGTITSPPFS